MSQIVLRGIAEVAIGVEVVAVTIDVEAAAGTFEGTVVTGEVATGVVAAVAVGMSDGVEDVEIFEVAVATGAVATGAVATAETGVPIAVLAKTNPLLE